MLQTWKKLSFASGMISDLSRYPHFILFFSTFHLEIFIRCILPPQIVQNERRTPGIPAYVFVQADE